jgi:cell wall-associated NlpC family hydrolase
MNIYKSLSKWTQLYSSIILAIAIPNALEAKENIDIDKVYLTSCVNSGVCSTDPKEVRLEDRVGLNLVVESMRDGKTIYYSDSDNLSLYGHKIDPSDIERWAEKDIPINWFKVETEKTNYDNGRDDGFKWDPIGYKETLVDSGNEWVVASDSRPTDKSRDIYNGLGTMRYKVGFTYNGEILSSPGKESKGLHGIDDDVHRISVRLDDSFTGWLTSLFNLPYIYGSSGSTSLNHQTEKHIGSDCADFIVGGYRKAGHEIPYTSAAGLTKFTDTIVRENNMYSDGENYYDGIRPLNFGSDVRVGDLILFGKSHIGVIAGDKSNPKSEYKGGPDKRFNKYDLVMHTLFDVPIIENMARFGSGSILRWKDE